MKFFGSYTNVVSLLFQKNGQLITFRPNQATTYTAARDAQLAPGDANQVLLSQDGTQTVTNKSISGSTNTITNVSLTSGVTGTLPIGNGGTGQTTAQNAIDALLPSQTSNSGKFLTTNGSTSSWGTASAGSNASITVYTTTSTLTPSTANIVYICNSSSAFTVNVGTAASIDGYVVNIKNINTGKITVDANSTETIDGKLTQILFQYSSMTMVAYNGNWYII